MKIYNFFNRYSIVINEDNIVALVHAGSSRVLSLEGFARMIWSCGLFESAPTRTLGELLVTEGLSGRKDYFWRDCREVFNRLVPIRDKHVMHVSCLGKLNEGLQCSTEALYEILKREKLLTFEGEKLKYKDFSDRDGYTITNLDGMSRDYYGTPSDIPEGARITERVFSWNDKPKEGEYKSALRRLRPRRRPAISTEDC